MGVELLGIEQAAHFSVSDLAAELAQDAVGLAPVPGLTRPPAARPMPRRVSPLRMQAVVLVDDEVQAVGPGGLAALYSPT